MSGQTYTGTVKSFNPYKGWGFVECPALGSDAFVLKSELNGFAVSKGDQLTFSVTQGAKGLQATNITLDKPNPDFFFGEIKTWNMAKGFGFLSSPATQAIFGKDVFALMGEIRNGFAAQGLQVLFKAKNSDRGPVASDIQVLGSDNWMPPVPAQGNFFGGGKGGWDSQSSWGGSNNWGTKVFSEEEVYFGTIKAVNDEKGWGHIACDAMTKLLGKDLFVMKTTIDEAKVHVGEQVSFTVAQGPKGPHATNIQTFDQQSAGMVFTGSIKTFNDTKGWGFIESQEARAIFRSDVFLHKRELNGKTVAVGDKVQFTVDTSGGRASATNLAVAR